MKEPFETMLGNIAFALLEATKVNGHVIHITNILVIIYDLCANDETFAKLFFINRSLRFSTGRYQYNHIHYTGGKQSCRHVYRYTHIIHMLKWNIS